MGYGHFRLRPGGSRAEMKPKAIAKEWDSESRVRENRMHGLMRGGNQTVIGLRASQPVDPCLLY